MTGEFDKVKLAAGTVFTRAGSCRKALTEKGLPAQRDYSTAGKSGQDPFSEPAIDRQPETGNLRRFALGVSPFSESRHVDATPALLFGQLL
jgi:hypothetical protein